MPKKKALVDYNKCHPDKCDKGICPAVAACPHHLLEQEAPYQIPMPNPSICQGCSKCVRACPYGAMKLM